MTFYPQLQSDRGIYEQWQRSLDEASLVNNIDDIVKTQTAEYNATLREVSEQQAEIIRASTDAICGTISEGLGYVTEGLQDVENAIFGLTNLLDCYLKAIVDEFRYNNLLTQNIALLLREPDSEKVRQKNIEKGLKFLNDAYRNPFFFNDALLFLGKAVEEDHTDYFVLHKIGLIYLYSHAHVNFEQAVAHFKKAATYSEVDTHPNAIRLARILLGDVRRPLSDQGRTVDEIRYLTGESLKEISIAYYVQGKFAESIGSAERAFTIAPTLLEAGFWLAKSLAASGSNDEAAKVLKSVIQQDEQYALKTLFHRDLSTKPEILQMNEELRQEEKQNSLVLYEEASRRKDNLIAEWKIMESALAKDFQEMCGNIDIANTSIEKDQYLSYLKAKKHLNEFISKS